MWFAPISSPRRHSRGGRGGRGTRARAHARNGPASSSVKTAAPKREVSRNARRSGQTMPSLNPLPPGQQTLPPGGSRLTP